MNLIVLHGSLKQMFGGPFNADVNSPVEAVRFLCGNFPAAKKILRDGSWYIKRVIGDEVLECGEEFLTFSMAKAPIHFYPATEGAGHDGGAIAKVILGGLLIALSFVPGAQIALLGLPLLTGAQIGLVGLGLALGGLAMLISPGQTNYNQGSVGSASNAPNTAVEGNAVSLVFGTFMATAQSVASQLITAQVSVGDTNYQWTDSQGISPKYIATSTGSYQPIFSA
jgi:predicted phage tail protein